MKRISLILMLAFVAGCATATEKNAPSLAREPANKDSKPQDMIEVRSLEGIHAKDCPPSVSKLPQSVTSSWKLLIEKANACLVSKNWFMVEQLGNSLAEVDPRGPWGAYYLSLAAEARDDLPRAFWMTELALKKNQKLSAAHYQRARLLWRTENFGDAVTELQTAVSLDPNLTDAHEMLGQIYMRDYELDKATKEFKTVVDKRPREINAIDALAEIEIYSGNGIGALAYLEKATVLAPYRIDLIVKKAIIHETLLNQPEEALTIYRAIQTSPPKTQWEGNSPVNVIQKIRDLEKIVQNKRNVARAPSSKEGAK